MAASDRARANIIILRIEFSLSSRLRLWGSGWTTRLVRGRANVLGAGDDLVLLVAEAAATALRAVGIGGTDRAGMIGARRGAEGERAGEGGERQGEEKHLLTHRDLLGSW